MSFHVRHLKPGDRFYGVDTIDQYDEAATNWGTWEVLELEELPSQYGRTFRIRMRDVDTGYEVTREVGGDISICPPEEESAVDFPAMPDMKDIDRCTVCGKTLAPGRPHVDTCSDRCYQKLLEHQRAQADRCPGCVEPGLHMDAICPDVQGAAAVVPAVFRTKLEGVGKSAYKAGLTLKELLELVTRGYVQGEADEAAKD